jgi:hypothetical protein
MMSITFHSFFCRQLGLCLIIVLLCCCRALAQIVPLPTPTRTWVSPGHTKYYVDSVNGDDYNDGLSENTPWQSLDKINSGTFGPGDWILFKSGGHWAGYLSPGGSGERRHPVKMTSYGDGPNPAIDGMGQTLAAVCIQNGEYWDIENLDITNTTSTPIPYLRGVEISLNNFGTAHGITLRNLNVHDINGPEDKAHGGSAIFCDNRGDTVRSRFDGLLIENCHITHADRNGITMDCGYWDRTKWYPNQHVVFRGNLLQDIGGDCIVAIGCDGAIIERNIVQGGRMRATDLAAGIWVWSCDNSVIQYNEVSGMHGQMDAMGFDSDWNSQNTIIQYNYSHNNQGGFIMACNNGDVKAPVSIGNTGTIIRYNISQDDQYRTITLSGPVKHVRIYNNDIYVAKADNPILAFSWNWGGTWPDDIAISNNIFDVAGKVHFQLGGVTNTLFDNNAYSGEFDGAPIDTTAIKSDDLLRDTGTGADGIKSLGGYHLSKSSACRNAGLVVSDNGGRDFWRKAVPSNKAPAVGASQR